MKFEELTEEEFTTFVSSRPEKNFFQTVQMKKRMDKNHLETYLVGVKEQGKVVAASFLAATGHQFMGKKTFEAYKGYIMDYHNQKLVQFMTDEVKKF